MANDVITRLWKATTEKELQSIYKSIPDNDRWTVINEINNCLKSIVIPALALGTSEMAIDGTCVVSIQQVYENMQTVGNLLLHPIPKKPQSFNLDDLPDFISDEQLSQLFGVGLSTIYNKRSKGELPSLNSLGLTNKSDIVALLSSKKVKVHENDVLSSRDVLGKYKKPNRE